MPNVEIRETQGEEMIESTYWLGNYAFRGSPPFRDKEEWRDLITRRNGSRILVAFEDERPAASAGSITLVQQVRGKLFPMGGVFGVSSHPESRRQGYVRQLMVRLFQDYHQQGRPLSCLYPFRESFYQRLGYVTFPHPRTAVFDPGPLSPLLKMDLGGTLEMMPINEGYEQYRAFLRKLQPQIHGFALFEEEQAETVKEGKQWLVLAREGDEVVGALIYKMSGEWLPLTLEATRFYYTKRKGRYLLLSWLARHIDQAGTVELQLPAFEMPKTWWPDLKLSIQLPFLAPQGRVIDVTGLAGLPVGSGAFSVRVEDEFCPWNEGIWRFEEIDGTLQVSPGGEAEGEVTIHALAALVYGTNDPADFAFRGWGDPPPNVQVQMRQMFGQLLPHLNETF